MRQALADRLLLSEALEAVHRMLSGYANRAQAGDSYLGAIAALLCTYPRSVALRCADPLHGVSRKTRFLPTVADVVEWCEKACEPMYADADWQSRVERQLAERAEAEAEASVVNPRLQAMTTAWLNRTDPVAAALVDSTDAAAREARERAGARIAAVTRRVIEHQYAARGEPMPAIPVSDQLRAILTRQNAERPA